MRWKPTLACLALMCTTVTIKKADAKPPDDIVMTYYDDANHSNVVGVFYYGCFGNSSWGVRTKYREVDDSGPCR